jgi:hypothetical protein
MIIANPISIWNSRDAAHIINNTFAEIISLYCWCNFFFFELFLNLNNNNGVNAYGVDLSYFFTFYSGPDLIILIIEKLFRAKPRTDGN